MVFKLLFLWGGALGYGGVFWSLLAISMGEQRNKSRHVIQHDRFLCLVFKNYIYIYIFFIRR